MGLDMYLNARRYVDGWQRSKPSEMDLYNKLVDAMGVKPTPGSPYFKVEVCIGYWRKANAIHVWFVDNCGDGVDNCEPYYVSREKAQELLDLCKKVLETRDIELIESALSPRAGFFFGPTDVDEYYFSSIEATVKILECALALDKHEYSIHYQASW